MMMMVEKMVAIIQEILHVKKDVAELREWLWKEKIQLEDSQDVSADQEHGGVPLPSIPEQPTIIQEVSKVQESGESCSDSSHECSKVQEAKEIPTIADIQKQTFKDTWSKSKKASLRSGSLSLDFRGCFLTWSHTTGVFTSLSESPNLQNAGRWARQHELKLQEAFKGVTVMMTASFARVAANTSVRDNVCFMQRTSSDLRHLERGPLQSEDRAQASRQTELVMSSVQKCT